MDIPIRLGLIEKEIIFDIKPDSENKEKMFDSITNFMKFGDYSITDLARNTYAAFKKNRKLLGLTKDKIKIRLKNLESQMCVTIGSNMTGEREERFKEEVDALKTFLSGKFKIKGEKSNGTSNHPIPYGAYKKLFLKKNNAPTEI